MSEPIYHYLDARRRANILLCAEHAGVEVPAALGTMGLETGELHRHIGWDLGIDALVRRLNEQAGFPALLGRYSRLVADLNRPVDSPECVIEISDGTPIPANAGLSDAEYQARIDSYHQPFHQAFSECLARLEPGFILSLHSFVPMLRTEGIPRPWHCGILYGSANGLARRCLAYLNGIPGLVVGDNQPYRVESDHDYTIPVHGDSHRIPTIIVEIRHDLIGNDRGRRYWADILCGMMANCCAD